MNGNYIFFTSNSRLVHCCLVIAIFGHMYHTTVAEAIVEKAWTGNFACLDYLMWSEKLKSVCFLDVLSPQLIKYQPDGKSLVAVSLQVNNYLGCLVPVKTNQTKFVIADGMGLGLYTWDGTSTDALTAENYLSIPKDNTRGVELVSCAKADASGRLWVGTSYQRTNETVGGMLYSVDESGKVAVKLSNIGKPCGIAWSLDNKHMYYAEQAGIISTEFNKDTGELIGNGTMVFDFVAENINIPAEPGSMTIDKDGFLWNAVLFRTFVLKIDPATKSVLTRVEIPDIRSTTSVMFVGPNVGDIYVTSADELFHLTNTGSKAGNGDYEVVVNWPQNKPPQFEPENP